MTRYRELLRPVLPLQTGILALSMLEATVVAAVGIGSPVPVLLTAAAAVIVAVGLLPPGLGSLGSPLGTCPLGTITVAMTNEMIHVWTVKGAPSRFGELDDEWVETNIGS